jgi:hypothetical protein
MIHLIARKTGLELVFPPRSTFDHSAQRSRDLNLIVVSPRLVFVWSRVAGFIWPALTRSLPTRRPKGNEFDNGRAFFLVLGLSMRFREHDGTSPQTDRHNEETKRSLQCVGSFITARASRVVRND